MNIHFRNGLYLLTSLSILLLNGCGGGSTNEKNDSDINDGKIIGGTDGKYKYNKISVAGSSITFGGITYQDFNGYVGFGSYVGEVEKYFREEIADTIGPDELTNYDEEISERMSYKGKLYKYSKDKVISGNISGDKIAIAYASDSNTPTIIEMIVDGKSLGQTTLNINVKPVKRNPDIGEKKSFRENNENAIKEWKLDENKQHTFKLKVIQGTLLLNFITNHMYRFQNAGIGGYKAASFLNDKEPTITGTTTKEIIDFSPDLFILESATNDANTWEREIEGKASTNNWKIEDTTVYYEAVDQKPKQIKLNTDISNVAIDDVVVMGNYNGDINNLAVGIVESVSAGSQIITLKQNAPTNINRRCRVKSIKEWETNVETVIQRVKTGVNHTIDIGIATSGVPNYYHPDNANNPNSASSRRLMGYREKGKILADEHSWMFYDFFADVVKVNSGISDGNDWSYDNTHPTPNGNIIFGNTIINKLKEQ